MVVSVNFMRISWEWLMCADRRMIITVYLGCAIYIALQIRSIEKVRRKFDSFEWHMHRGLDKIDRSLDRIDAALERSSRERGDQD